MAYDDVMHTEECPRLDRAAQEHALMILSTACQLAQRSDGGSPQRAETDFIPFAFQAHRRQSAAAGATQRHIAYLLLRGLIGTRSRVVEEQ
jgi:hypothetical protein